MNINSQTAASSRCRAQTKSGEPCRAYAMEDGLCHLHAHPEKAKEIGKRGGEQNRHYSTEDNAPILPPLKTAEDVQTAGAAK